MRIHADPDPQHWFKVIEVMASSTGTPWQRPAGGPLNGIETVVDDGGT
jgi:hypothetical protein